MDIIEKLNWRYATKQFDTEKKLTGAQLIRVLSATNLAASSFGLQPYNVLVIEDTEIRKRLREAAWGQSQVTDASQVIVFAAKTNLSDTHVDEFIQRISQTRNIPVEALAEYEGMMKGAINARPQEMLTQWAARQAYIALGFLLETCAVEAIDACPMEGFENDKFDDILGLKGKHLTSVVMATVGYRSSEDKYQHLGKVRKTLDELVIKY
ncbi:NAD(P)H-dependent oxidoreductase [Marinilabiliaceae bacterium JC017]|nr:NAD(P)H-dependent oxidoreductase [Marinilabiliaceae bacterium JC017]